MVAMEGALMEHSHITYKQLRIMRRQFQGQSSQVKYIKGIWKSIERTKRKDSTVAIKAEGMNWFVSEVMDDWEKVRKIDRLFV